MASACNLTIDNVYKTVVKSVLSCGLESVAAERGVFKAVGVSTPLFSPS